MNILCTTVEQSKQLIELGIDINTADMCWEPIYAYPKEGIIEYADKPTIGYIKYCLPGWSLSALMEIINHSKLKNSYVEIDFDNDNGYYVYFNHEDGEAGEYLYADHTTDLVYACCRIILTLNEKGLL